MNYCLIELICRLYVNSKYCQILSKRNIPVAVIRLGKCYILNFNEKKIVINSFIVSLLSRDNQWCCIRKIHLNYFYNVRNQTDIIQYQVLFFMINFVRFNWCSFGQFGCCVETVWCCLELRIVVNNDVVFFILLLDFIWCELGCLRFCFEFAMTILVLSYSGYNGSFQSKSAKWILTCFSW